MQGEEEEIGRDDDELQSTDSRQFGKVSLQGETKIGSGSRRLRLE